MATNYTTLLGFALPTTGELAGTWGDTVNNSITELVEDSIAGTATASVTSADWTLSTTGSGSVNEARCAILIPTGSPGVSRNIIAPSSSKAYIVSNQSNAAVVVKGSATTGATVAASTTALVAWNGSDFVLVAQNLENVTGTLPVSKGGTGATTLTGVLKGNGTSAVTASNVSLTSEVTGVLPIANGGTNASDTPTARTNLGATTLGSNLFTITDPNAITFPRFNANNTVSSLSAADFRTAIGAGTGTGTVTSVATSGSANGLSISGGTITTSGTITLSGTNYTANNVLLGNGTSAFQSVAPGASGNILTSNGTTWTSAAPAAGGDVVKIQTVTTTTAVSELILNTGWTTAYRAIVVYYATDVVSGPQLNAVNIQFYLSGSLYSGSSPGYSSYLAGYRTTTNTAITNNLTNGGSIPTVLNAGTTTQGVLTFVNPAIDNGQLKGMFMDIYTNCNGYECYRGVASSPGSTPITGVKLTMGGNNTRMTATVFGFKL